VCRSDLLAASGNLAYGGTLTVVLIGTNRLAYTTPLSIRLGHAERYLCGHKTCRRLFVGHQPVEC